jgi:hypothetical protein
LQGKKAIKSVELDQPISSGDELQVLAAVIDQSGKMEFLNRFRPGLAPEDVLGKDFCDFIAWHEGSRSSWVAIARFLNRREAAASPSAA